MREGSAFDVTRVTFIISMFPDRLIVLTVPALGNVYAIIFRPDVGNNVRNNQHNINN